PESNAIFLAFDGKAMHLSAVAGRERLVLPTQGCDLIHIRAASATPRQLSPFFGDIAAELAQIRWTAADAAMKADAVRDDLAVGGQVAVPRVGARVFE